MKNFTTYLFVMFMAMIWVFRIITAFCYNLGVEFMITPLDLNFEIVLLFVTFIAMILVVKRKIIGGVIYLLGYGLYFGNTILNLTFFNNSGLAMKDYGNLMFAIIGILLPILVLLDLLLDKNRKDHPVDKKTDWFFKNKDYDRQYDERADKNNYRTL